MLLVNLTVKHIELQVIYYFQIEIEAKQKKNTEAKLISTNKIIYLTKIAYNDALEIKESKLSVLLNRVREREFIMAKLFMTGNNLSINIDRIRTNQIKKIMTNKY